MSIRRKLHLTLALGLAISLILAGAGWWSSKSSEEAVDALVGENGRAEALSSGIALLAAQALSGERDISVRLTIGDRAGMQDLATNFDRNKAALLERVGDLRRLKTSARQIAEDESLLAEIESIVASWDQNHRRFWDAAQQGKIEAAASITLDVLVPIGRRISEVAARLQQAERKASQKAAGEAVAAAGVQRTIALVLFCFSLAAGLGGIWVTNQGLNSLGSSLIDMRRMADEVTQASGSVSNTSQALAVGATRQAASTEETAASSTEVKSMAQRNSESARSAAKLVTGAQEKFEQAHHSLARMEDTMAGIEVSAGKIARIIKVIDDIAFQTNILSLNAAVEAARAGDAGLGFAVVADEVRGLAQRCATAAQETAALINEAIARSAEGKVVAVEVAGTIRTITAETLSIRTLVDEVSAGSEDQARALDQISTAIGQIERITQDSAANAEEAAASEQLTAQATELRLTAQRIAELTGVSDVSLPPVVLPVAPATAVRSFRPPAKATAKFTQSTRSSSAPAVAEADDQDFRSF